MGFLIFDSENTAVDSKINITLYTYINFIIFLDFLIFNF